MKNINYILNCITLVGIFLLLNSNRLQAQTTETKLNPVCLDNTEQFTITSKYVAGENYIIQVGLPSGYSSANKSYPVLYISKTLKIISPKLCINSVG